MSVFCTTDVKLDRSTLESEEGKSEVTEIEKKLKKQQIDGTASRKKA